jgi:hypothetical protein
MPRTKGTKVDETKPELEAAHPAETQAKNKARTAKLVVDKANTQKPTLKSIDTPKSPRKAPQQVAEHNRCVPPIRRAEFGRVWPLSCRLLLGAVVVPERKRLAVVETLCAGTSLGYCLGEHVYQSLTSTGSVRIRRNIVSY